MSLFRYRDNFQNAKAYLKAIGNVKFPIAKYFFFILFYLDSTFTFQVVKHKSYKINMIEIFQKI